MYNVNKFAASIESQATFKITGFFYVLAYTFSSLFTLSVGAFMYISSDSDLMESANTW